MSDFEYVRQEDRDKYWKFCFELIKTHSLDRAEIPKELWHYTSADGLIEILKTGEIWSTQIACLNDRLEQHYFTDLVAQAVRLSRAQDGDRHLEVMLAVADKGLSNADFTTYGRFVACFSEVKDALGQWRGYGGGECGFAIGLQPSGLQAVARTRRWSLLVPLNYEADKHRAVAEDVLRRAKQFFLEGLQRSPPSIEQWAIQFLNAFAEAVDVVGVSVKHPAFRDEAEWRLAMQLLPEDVTSLIFRQKRTLLARHLPINVAVNVGAAGRHLVPITRIYVGPGPAQRVSQVSVGDLLKKYGYENVPIQLSKVPYRLP
jgi:hypothetical protein